MAGGCSVRTLLVFLVAAVVLRAYPSKAPQKGLPIPPPGHTAGQDSPIVLNTMKRKRILVASICSSSKVPW